MASPPMLDRGFFQKLLDSQLETSVRPVLQIVSVQQIAQAANYRLRLSDGFFSYPYCQLAMDKTERFAADGLTQGTAVIRVRSFSVNEMNGKRSFLVLDYEIVEKNCPIVGSPQPHTGRVEDYRGFDSTPLYQGFLGKTRTPPTHLPISVPVARGDDTFSSFEGTPRTTHYPAGGLDLTPLPIDSTPQLPGFLGKKRPPPTQLPTSVRVVDVVYTFDGVDSFIFEGAANYTPRWTRYPVADLDVTPINRINQHERNWRICGKVTYKGEIRDTPGPRSSKVFDFVAADQHGGEIKLTAWSGEATAFYALIEAGKTYNISGIGGVKPANRQYNTTDHPYEITLKRGARVELCHDITVPAKKYKLTVVSLDTISHRLGQVVDVMAVVHRVDGVSKVPSRKDPSKLLDKRDIHLIDQSETVVVYTVWGEKAINFDEASAGKVVAIHRALVREFSGGFSLSTTSGTDELFKDLFTDAVSSLLAWYRARGNSSPDTVMISHAGTGDFEANFRLIGMIWGDIFGVFNELRDSTTDVHIVAMILNVQNRETAIYKACSSCNTKLYEVGSGRYLCQKCGESGSYKTVMRLFLEVSDFSGSAKVTMWKEQSERLLGLSVDKLAELKEHDPGQYDSTIDAVLFRPYEFRVAIKREVYKGEESLRWTANSAHPLAVPKMIDLCNKTLAGAI